MCSALQLLKPTLLTSSSDPSRPMRAVSTIPSSGSAAKARAAGKASARISLSCTDVHDHQLLLLLCILSAAAGTSAAGTASEVSLACTPADTCLRGLLLHVLLLCNLLPDRSLHLPPEPARQLQFVLLDELPAPARMCASTTAWVGSDNPLTTTLPTHRWAQQRTASSAPRGYVLSKCTSSAPLERPCNKVSATSKASSAVQALRQSFSSGATKQSNTPEERLAS
jgi:hypothetical protein